MATPDEVITRVRRANDRFYRAFESLDMKQMEAMWVQTDRAKCVHPGWELLEGWDAVRQSWARAHARELRGFIRAHASAVDWLSDPRNKEEALRIFLARVPANTPPQAAETAYRALLTGDERFQRQSRIDVQGVETVLKLRAKYGLPGVKLREAAAYYDLSFHEAAITKP